MGLLIDGYNLLHVTGIIGRGIGPRSLERSRGALLNFLAATIDPELIPRTTVVFDAKDAPPGLPRQVTHRGMTVYYAAEHEDADALIEELILSDPAPRQLTVVSSDHRVQRAAKRRKVIAIDSDLWYRAIDNQRHVPKQSFEPAESKPSAPLSADEVERWLNEFGDLDWPVNSCEPPRQPAPNGIDADAVKRNVVDTELHHHELANPFPPGYADDLLKDSQGM